MEKICWQCRHKNRAEYRFCTRCGSRLISEAGKTDNSPRLVMLHGDRPSAVFHLNRRLSFIGRDKINTVVLQDTQISKHHAKVFEENGQFWIQDNRSKNGVFINGKKIREKERLIHGCLLKLGSTILRFETMQIH